MVIPKPEPLNKKKEKQMIPEDTLTDWIDQNVDTSGVNIIKVRDHYMWTQGDIERHRLDVFEKYEVEGEGEFCWTNRISERSFSCNDRSRIKSLIRLLGELKKKTLKWVHSRAFQMAQSELVNHLDKGIQWKRILL